MTAIGGETYPDYIPPAFSTKPIILPTENKIYRLAILAGASADSAAVSLLESNYHEQNYAKITIEEAAPAITFGDALTYNGSLQTQSVTSVMLGSIALDAGTDYTISGNTATNAGDYTLTIAVADLDENGLYDSLAGTYYLGGGSFDYAYSIAELATDNPQTGDNTNAPLSVVLVIISIMGMGTVYMLRKKLIAVGKK